MLIQGDRGPDTLRATRTGWWHDYACETWRLPCASFSRHSGVPLGTCSTSSLEKAMVPHSYSCPENPMDGGAWKAAVHGVAKSRTRLSDFTFTFHFRALEKEMATHSSVLAWRIPGRGSLMGCRLWGRTESDVTEAT